MNEKSSEEHSPLEMQSVKSSDSIISDSDAQQKRVTNWKAIIIATIITFLSSVEGNMIGNGEWPYMSTLDREATANFYGLSNSMNKLGHAVFVFVFAFWAHRYKAVKLPLIVGRLIPLASCGLYLCIEFFPTNRRFVLLFCYILFGIGAGSAPILRNYIAYNSTDDDRGKAFAVFYASAILSIVLGPMTQLAFSGIEYPGRQIFDKFYFHIFSAPLYIATLTNIVCLAILIIFFQDPQYSVEEKREARTPITLKRIKELIGSLRFASFSWPLAIVIILEKAFSNLSVVTMSSTVGPLLMAIFAFDGTQVILIMAIAQIVVGVLALVVSASFFVLKKRISLGFFFLLSLVIVILLYILTYPWPFLGYPLEPFNATTGTGCNPLQYSWCDTAVRTTPWIFLVVLVLVLGVAIPSSFISLDTIYSRLLGDIDQSLMQSVIVVAEDVIQVLGPLYASGLFTASGLKILWIVNFIITSISLVVWLAAWRPLSKYMSY